MRHHLHARIQKSLVVAGVIGMVMSDDEVLDGLIGDALDQRHQCIVVRLAGKLSIHQDQSLAGHPNRGIAAGAGDHVQPRLHLLDGLRLWRAACRAVAGAVQARRQPEERGRVNIVVRGICFLAYLTARVPAHASVTNAQPPDVEWKAGNDIPSTSCHGSAWNRVERIRALAGRAKW